MKLFSLILILFYSLASAQNSCVNKAEVLKKGTNEELASFRNWVKQIKLESADYSDWMQYVDEITIYFADVDNDGTAEYLVKRSIGSGGYTDLQLYRPIKDGFQHEEYVPP